MDGIIEKNNWKPYYKKGIDAQDLSYTVHTDCRISGAPSKDCMYGWGDKRFGEACTQHTVIANVPYKAAIFLSKLLVSIGHEVVVTKANDWTYVVNNADFAIHYKANHTH